MALKHSDLIPYPSDGLRKISGEKPPKPSTFVVSQADASEFRVVANIWGVTHARLFRSLLRLLKTPRQRQFHIVLDWNHGLLADALAKDAGYETTHEWLSASLSQTLSQIAPLKDIDLWKTTETDSKPGA